jgi:hypothetical protein
MNSSSSAHAPKPEARVISAKLARINGVRKCVTATSSGRA